MKKLFYTLTLLFCFVIATHAQDKKIDAKQVAATDAKELAQLVNLDATVTESLARLFEMKYTYLNQNLSDERKAALSKSIDAKLRATLSAEQMAILDKNKVLLDRLTK